ncbi:hypothetical protein JX265_011838 [Neoarthrinium moseri]|uniref:F-box domain-containing protein n=1 Tax=Neoarthrinium moseri TaxID=1658444 RepID=A0A9Q0AJ96_9PEZI|nr:uncharacterized protein JN550_010357 [Neoarthrinium moseri]KAI1847162.1 hypothetical protein JX266_006702 [Neoarthrinium moseri]KAI1856123.1 hypothetical protein JX265_011838 [Neoarthrinium moseri]KAI1862201.1 hypothetical protein JN550_010357 [Neoarthrinium moseri]
MSMKSIVSRLRRIMAASPTFGRARDGLSCLPVELHLLVLGYLGPDDVAAALNVCRMWRWIWLSDEIWPRLADRWFHGLSEHIYSTTTEEQDAGESFRIALTKHQRRIKGRFSSALYHGMLLESDNYFKVNKKLPPEQGGVHSNNDARDSDGHFATFRLYNSGRIAWWPESYALPYLAVVDDLRTKRRRIFSFPDHKEQQQGFKTAMSDKLFVMGKHFILHAWHLERDTLQSLDVPLRVERCVIEGEVVLVVAKNAIVYLWKFGENLQLVDMTPVYKYGPVSWNNSGDFSSHLLGTHRVGIRLQRTNTPIDFIIHPSKADAFFVVTLEHGNLFVHEFEDRKFSTSHRLEEDLLSSRALIYSGQLRWEKIDSCGGYNLLSIYLEHPEARNGDPDEDLCNAVNCQCQWDTSHPRVYVTVVSVCFNVYTRKFRVFHHHPLPGSDPKTFHIWNQRLISVGCFQGSNIRMLSSLSEFTRNADLRNLVIIPVYTTSHPKRIDQGNLTRRHRITMKSDMLRFEIGGQTHHPIYDSLEYLFDVNQAYAENPVRRQRSLDSGTDQPGLEAWRLVGDDDFLVYFRNNTYTAWSF